MDRGQHHGLDLFRHFCSSLLIMVQQVTQGIKVSVQTRYEDRYHDHYGSRYAFSYTITIENLSGKVVQLMRRKWYIKDALNVLEIVEGEGVIGQQPILEPGGRHSYKSGCLLVSPVGSMRGYYEMKSDTDNFKVGIPLFKLSAPFAMN